MATNVSGVSTAHVKHSHYNDESIFLLDSFIEWHG